MKSTPWRDRTFRISTNLGAESILEQSHAVDEALGGCETLGRRKAQEPEDESVVVPLSQRRLGSRLMIFRQAAGEASLKGADEMCDTGRRMVFRGFEGLMDLLRQAGRRLVGH